MEIRFAEKRDAETLSKLNYEFNGVKKSIESVACSIENNKQETIAVAVKNDEVVGFLCAQKMTSFCYDESYVEFTELYVEAQHRRKGIAGRLIEFLEDYFFALGIKSFRLLTGEANKNARVLYEQKGFNKTDELLYRKELNDRER